MSVRLFSMITCSLVLAALACDTGSTAAAPSARGGSAKSPSAAVLTTPPARGPATVDPCSLLSNADAQAIVGAVVTSMAAPSGDPSTLRCSYTTVSKGFFNVNTKTTKSDGVYTAAQNFDSAKTRYPKDLPGIGDKAASDGGSNVIILKGEVLVRIEGNVGSANLEAIARKLAPNIPTA